jgi:hypothetical protein
MSKPILIKPMMTLTEFAAVMKMTRKTTRRMIERLNIPFEYVNHKIFIYYNKLQASHPDLAASIYDVAAIEYSLRNN